ncbi:hypothetical protein [Achromobacter xylosoxidans]
MSENIASFDSFETDAQIAAHQAGLIRIVLEGETDVSLFRRFWFSHRQDVFEFVEAGEVATASGCTGVADGVANCLRQGIPAVGIVDRDTLFRQKDWDLLFSLDLAALNPDPAVADIYFISRWEVEAYLLEAGCLPAWISVAHRNPPAPAHICERALTQILEACETLLSAAHYFAAEHEGGKPVAPGMFCDQPLSQVQSVCSSKLAGSDPAARQVAEKVAVLVSAVIDSKPVNETDRLPFFLRYVDTKRLLKRLTHVLNIKEDAFWILAALMMSNHQRPTELDNLLSQVETRFAM